MAKFRHRHQRQRRSLICQARENEKENEEEKERKGKRTSISSRPLRQIKAEENKKRKAANDKGKEVGGRVHWTGR